MGLQWVYGGFVVVNLHQVFRHTEVFCGFVVGFVGVEATGFDLEPIWCHGCGVVG